MLSRGLKLFANNIFCRRTHQLSYKFSSFCLHRKQINKYKNNFVSLATIGTKKQELILERFCRIYCSEISSLIFENVCDETLSSLNDFFEELIERTPHLQSADVSYNSGVLTVNFGHPYGTFVINRQSPNKQIWLSSPISGPKRYDFVPEKKQWVYKHDNVTLHQLLQKEVKDIVKNNVDLSNCSFC